MMCISMLYSKLSSQCLTIRGFEKATEPFVSLRPEWLENDVPEDLGSVPALNFLAKHGWKSNVKG